MFQSRRLSTLLTTVTALWLVTPWLVAHDQLTQGPGSREGQPDAPEAVNLWQPGDPGQPLRIDGWVRSATGKPIVGAVVTVWQADGTGTYHDDRYRASLHTGKDGKYRFNTVLPGQTYSVKHIHVIVTHPQYEPVETQILFKGDPHLDEAAAAKLAITLEEGKIKGKTVLFGTFDIVMRPAQGS